MSWKTIRGHDKVVRQFDEAVRRGRLAHAYLFTGPPGVGKRLFAGELAKALLCEQPTNDRLEACDQCQACTLVAAGTHPDLFAANRPEDKLEFPIEVMKEFCANFALKSARGKGKVGILDDADDLNEESANCFLKTLEEPPPRSVLILIAASAEQQLSTIVSRCQVIRFQPLAKEIVVEFLRAQGVEDAKLLDRAVRLSGGSPGQARDLADPALWAFRRALLQGLCRPRPDSVELAKQWAKFVEEAGKESAVQRRRVALVLKLIIDSFSQALSLSQQREPAGVDPEELRLLSDLASRLGPETLLEMLERCLQADMQNERRVQLVLVLEALMDALGQQAAAVK